MTPQQKIRKIILKAVTTKPKTAAFRCIECGVGINADQEIFLITEDEIGVFDSKECLLSHLHKST